MVNTFKSSIQDDMMALVQTIPYPSTYKYSPCNWLNMWDKVRAKRTLRQRYCRLKILQNVLQMLIYEQVIGWQFWAYSSLVFN